MEPRLKRTLLPVAVLAGCLFACGAASAQLVLGQYVDEAPLGTWNIYGAPSAPAVALGGTQFARAFDVSASLANPSLLTKLARTSASLAASYGRASMYRYALVNTGVVESRVNLGAGVLGIDHGGFAVRTGDWAFALAAAAPESYARPGIVIWNGGYQLTFEQSGYLRVFHAGVARRLGPGLALGIGVNYVTGRLDRTTVEQTADILRIVTITDDRHESYRGVYLNGGLTWEAAPKLSAAAIVRSPYVKRGPATSLLRYEVPVAGTDIRIEAEAENSYRQPWIVGAGVTYRPAAAWSLTADAAWFGWSRYEATYFEEPLPRSFRDILKGGLGVEYLAPTQVSGKPAGIPLRLGLTVDPQPMTEVHSTYFALTFGTGLVLESFVIDISASLGRENGSGRDLGSGRISLAMRYIFHE
jgi:hypothetical protein